MYAWFLVCLIGAVSMIPVHYLSVEHLKLQKRYGKERGTRIGEVLGVISGWGLFVWWVGIWFSPQPRFALPILREFVLSLPVIDFSVTLVHGAICSLFLIPGSWLGIKGVRETTLRTAETHRTERIVTCGVYSIVRHPQYLGWLLAHIGISFVVSAWFSLVSTPLMVVIVLLISRKEETELIKEFGCEYRKYQEKVPMLIPRGLS